MGKAAIKEGLRDFEHGKCEVTLFTSPSFEELEDMVEFEKMQREKEDARNAERMTAEFQREDTELATSFY